MATPPFYLFLDFDGVLHADDADVMAIFGHADQLGVMLADHPEVQVVVSSSWRTAHPLEELREFCGPILGPRLVGITPQVMVKGVLDPNPPYSRFTEIAYWLMKNATPTGDARDPLGEAFARGDWAALDDSDFWFPTGCRQLIHVLEGLGLDEAHLVELKKRLVKHYQRTL